MKWLLLLAILATVPAVIGLLRSNPKAILWIGLLVGFLPFGIAPYHLYTAPVSWAMWPGTVKGIELSFLDSLALAILLSTGRVPISRPVKAAFCAFFVAVLFSTVVAQNKTAALFYVWQLMRTALVCVAVARASARHHEFPMQVFFGLGAGLSLQAFNVLMHFGENRAGGDFGANLLGLMTDFVGFGAIALLLAGFRTRTALLLCLCDFIAVVGGGSRATIGLFAFGVILVTCLSFWHQTTGRKGVMAISVLLMVALAAPLLLSSVNQRSAEMRESSNSEREAFKAAARMILDDHPLGVGANQYVIVANVGGYSEKAGVPWNSSERSAPVHNSYYLAAAELGYAGAATLIGFLLAVILVGLRAIKNAGGGSRAALLVGAVASVSVAVVHITYEWVAMLFTIHYLFAIAVGLILGIRLDAISIVRANRVRSPQPKRIAKEAQAV